MTKGHGTQRMAKRKALIVDDEPDIRELLAMTLAQLNLEVVEAGDLNDAIDQLKGGGFAFCLTDMRLPDGDGLALIDYVQDHHGDTPIAVITAHGSTDLAVEALKRGAFDFITKPVQLPRLRALVQAALSLKPERRLAVDREHRLFGSSPAINVLRQQISRVARSQAPVLISGESGSGKEIVARTIHSLSPRAGAPFVAVNCGAIPAELMESEFFGHRKGSFTGAHQDKQGLFVAADGGTLFLDEVADLPLAMQVKLLRGIQEKAIRPVGAERELAVDVRILSATHKNLLAEVAACNFRQDLYYRINVIEIAVPSLRERRQDIAELARLFLQRFAARTATAVPTLTADALAAIENYDFPGNVRELENILERACTLCDTGRIAATDLQFSSCAAAGAASPEPPQRGTERSARHPDTMDQGAAGEFFSRRDHGSIDQYLTDIERNIVEKTLGETRWNRTAAAEKLGISFRQLRYKLKKLGLE